MAITAGQTVVDLGAGTGYFLARLSKAAGPSGKVIGLDIEPNMVDHMAKRASRDGLMNVEARRVALDGSDLPQGVDRFLIVDTWHHIDARGAYAKRLAAALKPGGAVIVVDFTRDARKGRRQNGLSPESSWPSSPGGAPKSRLAEESLPHQSSWSRRSGDADRAAALAPPARTAGVSSSCRRRRRATRAS